MAPKHLFLVTGVRPNITRWDRKRNRLSRMNTWIGLPAEPSGTKEKPSSLMKGEVLSERLDTDALGWPDNKDWAICWLVRIGHWGCSWKYRFHRYSCFRAGLAGSFHRCCDCIIHAHGRFTTCKRASSQQAISSQYGGNHSGDLLAGLHQVYFECFLWVE